MERESAAPEGLLIEEVREEGLAALLDLRVHMTENQIVQYSATRSQALSHRCETVNVLGGDQTTCLRSSALSRRLIARLNR